MGEMSRWMRFRAWLAHLIISVIFDAYDKEEDLA